MIDAHSDTRQLARVTDWINAWPGNGPLGLSITDGRVAWAENHGAKCDWANQDGYIRAVNVGSAS